MKNLLAHVACAALGMLTETVVAEEMIKVGLNIPLSGPFANFGELYIRSSQVAIEAINAKGGADGRKFEVIPFDNKNSPQEALLVLRQITDRRIPFMIQSGGAHIAVALAEATQRHNERDPANRLLFFVEPGDQGMRLRPP